MTLPRELSVLIVGGGIGGLCLAHGLRRAGIAVQVYERTTARTDWLQGYRIHLNPAGTKALPHCLHPRAWRTFLDTVSADAGGFGFMTEDGADLLRFRSHEINAPDTDPAARHYAASRISLREILLSELDDVVCPGKKFVRYEQRDNGRVTAWFSDGSSASADLLIGADGANSRVRHQLLPHAARLDTGVVAVAGKFRLTADAGDTLPIALTTDANIVIPRRRGMLFTAVWPGDPDTTRDGTPTASRTAGSGYAFWAYADAADQFPHPPADSDGAALRALIGERTARWAPSLRQLIAGSDPTTVHAFTVRSAAPVTGWPTGPVTLLGDAIHNMTPMAGVGANTALRDADLLRRALIEVRDGSADLPTSLAGYEREMLRYGFAAVRTSLRHAKQAGTPGWAGRALFRTAIRAVRVVPPLRRAMAGAIGS